MSEASCTTFWCDYIQTQFDPAHLLSELGFTVAFELVQLVLIALLYKKVIRPYLDSRHRLFDQEHGLTHEGDLGAHRDRERQSLRV